MNKIILPNMLHHVRSVIVMLHKSMIWSPFILLVASAENETGMVLLSK